MTVPRNMPQMVSKVSEMVRGLIPTYRDRTTTDERTVGVYLRGNQDLLLGLSGIIKSRIEGRAKVPEPSDPVQCKAMLARDRELQWLLAKLEFIYTSPVAATGEQEIGEQP